MATIPAVQLRTLYVLPIRSTLPTGQEVYQYKLVDQEEITKRKVAHKRCTACLCPDLIANTTIVRLINVDQAGRPLPVDLQAQELILALDSFDKPQVPLWTQSSGKSGTYYFVPEWAYEELANSLGMDREKDAEKFASYIGLLYSDVAEMDVVAVPAMWGEPLHGEDGNAVISRALFGSRTRQVRMIVINSRGWPTLLGKGILTPLATLDGDPRGAYLNSTQVKVAHPDVNENDRIIIVPTIVDDRRIHVPATWELIELLQDTPEVRRVLKQYTETAVNAICDLLREGNRSALLERLGQLRLDDEGNLIQTDRNVLSALRANFPWCAELEQRLGRVFIDEIVSAIAPSGGVMAWSYLAVQHNQLGARSCGWDGDVKSIAYRVPCTSIDNVVPFAKVLRNGLVHPDVMAAMDGDSDGDRINVIDDPKIVELFVKYRLDFRAGHKPEKTRAQSAMSVERQIELAVQTREDLGGVGRLTMAMHINLIRGRFKDAANAGWLAQLCPMLLKWNILIDGLPARDVIMLALAKRLPTAQWRRKQYAAKQLESPRELYNLGIRKPASIIDYTWNVMVRTVREWVKANPLKPLSLPAVARMAWEAHPGQVHITAADLRWRFAVVRMWGEYWHEYYGAKGVSHKPFYQALEDIGQKATVPQLASLLLWLPESGVSNGFALKWHVVGRRWEELLGLRQEVIDWVVGKQIDIDLTAALNAAVRASLGLGYAPRCEA